MTVREQRRRSRTRAEEPTCARSSAEVHVATPAKLARGHWTRTDRVTIVQRIWSNPEVRLWTRICFRREFTR